MHTNPIPHKIGASLSFIASAVHNLWHALLRRRLNLSSPQISKKRIHTSIATFVFLLVFVFSTVMGQVYCPDTAGICSKELDLVSIFAEWIGATTLMIYNLSYNQDFKDMPFTKDKLKTGFNFRMEFRKKGVKIFMLW